MATLAPRTITLRSGETCTLRSAGVDDAEALLTLVRSVAVDAPFAVTQRHEMTSTPDEERKRVCDHLDRPGWIAIVAVVQETLVGICNFRNGDRERVAHRGSLGLSVASSWRGRGIGRALMEALLDWAAAHPTIEKVSLAVVEENAPAVSLYRKLGFTEEARRPREIRWGPGRYWADLLMFKLVKP
jgi:RimJ/RimL family protein N-acetyltransferase